MTEQLTTGAQQPQPWRGEFHGAGADAVGGRRRWWLPPVLATVLAVPPGGAGMMLAGYAAMLPCDPGACGALDHWRYGLWAVALLPVLPYALCWAIPRGAAPWLRWALFGATVVCVAGLWAALLFWRPPGYP